MSTIARRFIIICLIFVIFALLMAAAVANSDRRSGTAGTTVQSTPARFIPPHLHRFALTPTFKGPIS
jgi:ABC-type phosphate/phosphonate transport system permease subunit